MILCTSQPRGALPCRSCTKQGLCLPSPRLPAEHGLLRYLNADGEEIGAEPGIGFNYLGRMGSGGELSEDLWRIDPAALPRLQALRTRAMAWKGTDDGKRELTLGVELTGCQKSGSTRQAITTLMRFAEPGEYIPIVRNIDLAETMPAAELKQRFPVCGAAGVLPGQPPG